MAAAGLAGGLIGLAKNPTVQKGVQNVFNTATSIGGSMASNMGRIAQGLTSGGSAIATGGNSTQPRPAMGTPIPGFGSSAPSGRSSIKPKAAMGLSLGNPFSR
jgi:hypothetical protein